MYKIKKHFTVKVWRLRLQIWWGKNWWTPARNTRINTQRLAGCLLINIIIKGMPIAITLDN